MFPSLLTFLPSARKQLLSLPPTPRTTTLSSSLALHTDALAHAIVTEMSRTTTSRAELTLHIQLLVNLGLVEMAREAFLASRSHLFRSRVLELKYQGEIQGYVTRLVQVFVAVVRSTVRWYVEMFGEAEMKSGTERRGGRVIYRVYEGYLCYIWIMGYMGVYGL